MPLCLFKYGKISFNLFSIINVTKLFKILKIVIIIVPFLIIFEKMNGLFYGLSKFNDVFDLGKKS